MELVESLMPASLLQEGLGSGALQEFLDSIDKQAEQIKLGLLAALGEQAARADIDPALLAAMVSLAELAPSPNGPEAYIADAAQKYMEIQEHVKSLQAELKAAQAAADLEATLREFRSFLENGQFVDAASSVVVLRKIVEDARAKSAGAAAGWGAYGQHYGGQQQQHHSHADDAEAARLSEACARCEAELDEALEAACQEAVDASIEGCVLTITAALPSGGDVGDLWAALELTGMAGRHLSWVADTLLQHVLPPVLDGTARFDAHASHGGDAAIIKWLAVPRGQPPTPGSIGRVEADCTQLLTVLADALFRGREGTLAAFGAAFWPRFVQLYAESFLRQLDAQGAAVLRGRQQAAVAMEAAARELGLLAGADAEPLAAALGRAVQKSYHAAQEGYLARARAAAAAAGPGAAPVTVGAPLPLDGELYARLRDGQVKAWEVLDPPSGWDCAGPVLATGFFQVSAAALEVAAVMDDALSDAVASGDASLAQACVVAVSKIAAMFATLVPSPSAADAPQPALLRHNDLNYAANHLLLLPFLHSPELEELTGGEVWFGDEAVRLRAQARALANESLSVQQSALSEPLSQLLPLSNAAAALASSGRARGRAAASAGGAGDGAGGPERAVKQILYTLERAGRLLWPTLPPGEALEFSSRLLGPLFKALSEDVLRMEDIGERECEAIVALCRPLVAGAPAALLASVEGTGQQQGLEGAGVDVRALLEAALQQRAWGLRKLACILTLLEAKLTDIVRRWESGELRHAGLSLPEVTRLVCSVFENTDHRAQCLQRIEVAAF